jgi:hypothetical protein
VNGYRRLDGKGLAALVAPNRHTEVLLGDLARRDAVGAMGTDRHSTSSALLGWETVDIVLSG